MTQRTCPRRAAFASALLVALALPVGCGGREPPQRPDEPEELFAYPISHIFVKRNEQQPTQTITKTEEILDELWSGRDFGEMARARSDDAESAEIGGFLGFFRPEDEGRLAGAVQVLLPGRIQGPLLTEQGAHIFTRHGFEEGRRLEAETTVAARGFFVPWTGSSRPGKRSQEEARALAEDLARQIASGQLEMGEAATKYGPEPPKRPDAFIGLVQSAGGSKSFYDAVAAVEVGKFVPVREFPGGFTVVQRAPLLRSIVRHVLIMHRDSPQRSLKVRRSRGEAEQLAKKVLAETAPDGSNWSEIVKRYHEEAGGVPVDGSLGVIATGDLYPDMENVVLETTPGRVASRLAESPGGFHIMYRVK